MKKRWKLSCFTTVIGGNAGDLLLHNSFMGAIARIPAREVERIRLSLQDGIDACDVGDPMLGELCEQGFFVPSDLQEQEVVRDVLDREQAASLGLMLLAHENCNFRCAYCYEEFRRGKMPESVRRGIAAFVDRQIEHYRGLTVSWFGGEPLLGADVIRELSTSMIDSCERRGATYSSGMSTNGYLLTPEMVDLLFECRVNSFQVCIDGPEPLHNQRRRLAGGGGTYRRIIDNLTSMRAREEDFFVSIRTNFDDESAPLIEQWLVDEIAPRFAHDPRFGMHFEPIARLGGPNDAVLAVCDPRAAFSLGAQFFEKALALGLADLTVKRFLIPHGMVCYAAKEPSYIVGADGTLYKCSVAFDDPRNAVGRLEADGTIWLDDAKASMWTSLERRDTSDCDTCSLYPCCQGKKCPLVTLNQDRPGCPISREMLAALVKMVAYADGGTM